MVLNFLMEAEQTKVENITINTNGFFFGIKAAKVIAKQTPKFRPNDNWVAKIIYY